MVQHAYETLSTASRVGRPTVGRPSRDVLVGNAAFSTALCSVYPIVSFSRAEFLPRALTRRKRRHLLLGSQALRSSVSPSEF